MQHELQLLLCYASGVNTAVTIGFRLVLRLTNPVIGGNTCYTYIHDSAEGVARATHQLLFRLTQLLMMIHAYDTGISGLCNRPVHDSRGSTAAQTPMYESYAEYLNYLTPHHLTTPPSNKCRREQTLSYIYIYI